MQTPSAKRKKGGKPPIVDIVDENGEEITPPPPEVLETDAELSPEEIEQARRTIC